MRCCTCGRKLTEDDMQAYADQCDDCARAEFEELPDLGPWLEHMERGPEPAGRVH